MNRIRNLGLVFLVTIAMLVAFAAPALAEKGVNSNDKVAPSGTLVTVTVSDGSVDAGDTVIVGIVFSGVSPDANLNVHVVATGPAGSTMAGELSKFDSPYDYAEVKINIPDGAEAGSWNVSEIIIQGFAGNTFSPTQLTFTSFSGGAFTVLESTPADPADTTAPIVTPTITGTLGNNGWYVSDVTVSWDWYDNESAIVSTTGDAVVTLTDDTAGTTVSFSATSEGGTTEASVTIKIDKTAPVVSYTMPAGPYLLNGSYAVAWTAADAMSGLVTPATGSVDLDTASIGSKSLTIPAATDEAGNSSSEITVDYSVIYGFNGLLSPYSPTKSNKVGSSIPLKWNYTDAAGTVVASAVAAPQVVISGVSVVNDSGKSGPQYDALTSTWQWNWQTKGLTAGTYNVYIVSGLTGQTNFAGVITLTAK